MFSLGHVILRSSTFYSSKGNQDAVLHSDLPRLAKTLVANKVGVDAHGEPARCLRGALRLVKQFRAVALLGLKCHLQPQWINRTGKVYNWADPRWPLPSLCAVSQHDPQLREAGGKG